MLELLLTDAVKSGTLEMQWFPRFSFAFLASTKSSKVLYRLGDRVAKETHDDTSTFASFNVNVEIDLVGNLFALPKAHKILFGEAP